MKTSQEIRNASVVDTLLNAVGRLFHAVSGLLLVLCIGLIFADVVIRLFTGQPIRGVVELVALENANIKYSTVQNWYSGNEFGQGSFLHVPFLLRKRASRYCNVRQFGGKKQSQNICIFVE